MNGSIACALQARLMSSRLLAKALLSIQGKTILRHCFDVALSGNFSRREIFLLTSQDSHDDLLAGEFAMYGIKDFF